MSKRNYQAEYRRRIERAAALGLSRSQARGHARAGEPPIRSPKALGEARERIEKALRILRAKGNQGTAAREAGISAERFRRHLREEKLAERQGRSWIITDRRQREMLAITTRGYRWVRVAGFEPASLLGRHDAAVKAFVNSNDATHLTPFIGVSVTDVRGKTHLLETRPNTLHRLTSSEGESFEAIYRLTT